MQKIKLIIIFMLLSCVRICLAQDQNDFILLTDSSYITGEVSVNKNQITIENKSLDKPQSYDLEQVLVFKGQNNLYEIVRNFAVTYESNRKQSKEFHIDLGYAKVKIQGTVSLYEFGFCVENHLGEWQITEKNGFFSGRGTPAFHIAPGGNRTMVMMPTGTLARGGPYLVTQYLLKKAGSSEMVAVPSDMHPENFKEFMAAYFADCKELAYRIRKDNYSYEQIQEIINMYNLWVKQHPDAAKLTAHKTNKLNGF